MYKLIAPISFLIRNLYLPNPFNHLKNGELLNWGLEIILAPITFFIVGLFYRSGSAPAWGSFLYLFFYIVHIGLIFLCRVLGFQVLAVSIVLVFYLAGLLYIKNKLSRWWF